AGHGGRGVQHRDLQGCGRRLQAGRGLRNLTNLSAVPDAGAGGPGGGRTPDISLEQARALIERAIDKAEQLGLRGSVAVVGASGVLVSASRMDASGAGGMARARSKAWIAATQQVPSAEHLRRMVTIAGPVAQGFVACSPEANFPGAGGMPVRDGDLAG